MVKLPEIRFKSIIMMFRSILRSTGGLCRQSTENNARFASNITKDLKDFFSPKVAPRTDSHSQLLTKSEDKHLYKLQFHNVKPEALGDYKAFSSEFNKKLESTEELPMKLAGCWSCWYGDQDTVVHLWRYNNGFKGVSDTNKILGEQEWYHAMTKDRSKMLLHRNNQMLYEFSFWNDVVPRDGPNIYELREYKLKAGTLVEWANAWSRGIRHRQQNEQAVGGFFSEIGELNTVYHLWAYKDLEARKATRQKAWENPGWDNTVYYTVPLIREMSSRILVPLPHSPLQ